MSRALVSFDLDGTLYDLRAVRWRVLLRIGRRGRVLRALTKAHQALRGHAFVDGNAFDAEVLARVVRQVGGPAARRQQDIEDVEGTIVDAIRAAGPRPDARPTLEDLVHRRIAIAVVSDHAVDKKLAALGLADLPFAHRLAASATGALKPHPRVFRALLAAANLEAEAVGHIGDRADTDGEAARAAGIRAEILRPGPRPLASAVEALLAA